MICWPPIAADAISPPLVDTKAATPSSNFAVEGSPGLDRGGSDAGGEGELVCGDRMLKASRPSCITSSLKVSPPIWKPIDPAASFASPHGVPPLNTTPVAALAAEDQRAARHAREDDEP